MSDESSPEPSPPNSSAPVRARPWKRPPSEPTRPRPYRFVVRLIGIPVAAVAGVLLYQGLRDRLFLPQCDSENAKHTLADVLKQYRLAPLRYEPIKTVSSSKDEVVCSAILPLPDGGNVAIDYRFFWQGSTASMAYKVTPPPAPPAAPAR
ncbi:MAG TPA: hypothetical protein VK825_10505 [Xanthobacteraceae bacterium]|jgi:hypothetical protein|nr:hypothetical protein [Xanthobacteraceae bacterium]